MLEDEMALNIVLAKRCHGNSGADFCGNTLADVDGNVKEVQ